MAESRSIEKKYLMPLRTSESSKVPGVLNKERYRIYSASSSAGATAHATVFKQDNTIKVVYLGAPAPTQKQPTSTVNSYYAAVNRLEAGQQTWSKVGLVLPKTNPATPYCFTPFFSGCAFGIFDLGTSLCVIHLRSAPGNKGLGLGSKTQLMGYLAGEKNQQGQQILTVTHGPGHTPVQPADLRAVLANSGSALRFPHWQTHNFKRVTYNLGSVIGAWHDTKGWRFYAQQMTGEADRPTLLQSELLYAER